jgi:hypothetical protein
MSTSDPQSDSARPFLISAVVMLFALAALDSGLSVYAKKHLVFEVTLRRATASRAKNVVILGDSRMVQGVDPEVMNDLLGRAGRREKVAFLPIGAVDLPGQALALRQFFRADAEASLVVLGFSSTLLVPSREPHRDPDDMVGNLAVELSWSDAGDVRTFFPGFPFRHPDAGIRFLLSRGSALGTCRSLAWFRASSLRDKLVGRKKRPMNQFGAIEDMKLLVDSFATTSLDALSSWCPGQKQATWFQQIAESAKAHGASLLVVDIPMPRRYRDQIASHSRFNSYTAALKEQLRWDNISYANFSVLEAVSAEDFPDGIHLGSDGRDRFTRVLSAVVVQELDRSGTSGGP